MQPWIVPAVIGALVLLVGVLVALLALGRSRTARELAVARAEAASLRAQVDEIERRLSESRAEPAAPPGDGYLITRLGEVEAEAEAQPPPEIDRVLFADLVLRETVVKAAARTHGLRRALAPEARNRIRFEMRREVKRARKQRRADLREARRDLAARQRAVDAA